VQDFPGRVLPVLSVDAKKKESEFLRVKKAQPADFCCLLSLNNTYAKPTRKIFDWPRRMKSLCSQLWGLFVSIPGSGCARAGKEQEPFLINRYINCWSKAFSQSPEPSRSDFVLLDVKSFWWYHYHEVVNMSRTYNIKA